MHAHQIPEESGYIANVKLKCSSVYEDQSWPHSNPPLDTAKYSAATRTRCMQWVLPTPAKTSFLAPGEQECANDHSEQMCKIQRKYSCSLLRLGKRAANNCYFRLSNSERTKHYPLAVINPSIDRTTELVLTFIYQDLLLLLFWFFSLWYLSKKITLVIDKNEWWICLL